MYKSTRIVLVFRIFISRCSSPKIFCKKTVRKFLITQIIHRKNTRRSATTIKSQDLARGFLWIKFSVSCKISKETLKYPRTAIFVFLYQSDFHHFLSWLISLFLLLLLLLQFISLSCCLLECLLVVCLFFWRFCLCLYIIRDS